MVLHAELDVGVRNAVSFAKTDEVSIALTDWGAVRMRLSCPTFPCEEHES